MGIQTFISDWFYIEELQVWDLSYQQIILYSSVVKRFYYVYLAGFLCSDKNKFLTTLQIESS
jgi:hypothetical protein